MQQLEGFVEKGKENLVRKLKGPFHITYANRAFQERVFIKKLINSFHCKKML